MKSKIALGCMALACALFVGLFVWQLVASIWSTKQDMRAAEELLASGVSIEGFEEVMGESRFEYAGGQIPDYIKSIDGYNEREGALLREYNREDLPYWKVFVQYERGRSTIVWYHVTRY